MSGGPVSVSGPHPPIGTTPRLAPKARHDRRADPRRSTHRKPVRALPTAPSGSAEPGVSAKPPQKRQTKAERHPGMDLSLATPSGADRKPEAPAKAATGANGGEGEGEVGKSESRKVGKSESRKAGRPGKAGKPESRKAGKPKSREAEKPKSREAEKPKSRKAEKQKAEKQKAEKQESRAEAEKSIKKRRRTVGCTSACGSQRSPAYRNYLLR